MLVTFPKHPAFAVVLGMTTAGCGSAPTQPSTNATLLIRPATDGVVIGKSQAFHAWLSEQSGEREVAATWTLDNPQVATVNTSGMVTGLRLGTTSVSAMYSGMSAVRNIAIVSDCAGHWQGTAKVTACSRQSGAGPNTCGAELGLVLPLDLLLAQDGRSLDGSLTLHRIVITGPVTGIASANGSMTLAGTLRSTDLDHPFQMVITRWDTSVDATAHLTGTFGITDTFQNAFGTQVHSEEYEIVSAVR